MVRRIKAGELERRSRLTVLCCAVLLCISPLIGGWLVDHCPLHIRDPDSAKTLWLWTSANPRPDVLLLGSSRLGSFVRTAQLALITRQSLTTDPAHIFNAAISRGEPIKVEHLVRRLLASEAPPPPLVLMETNPDLLARDNIYFNFLITHDLTAAELPLYLRDILRSREASMILLSSRLTPFFRHRSQFLAWVGEKLASPDAENKTGQNEPSQADAIEVTSFQYMRNIVEKDPNLLAIRMRRGAYRFQSSLRHYQLAGATSLAFEATVAALRQHGCAVVLVQPPLSSTQRALVNGEVRRQFDIFIHSLESSYDCTFADYSDRLPDTSFVDNHHANDAGSFDFTKSLAQEVVAPAWRKLKAERAPNE